MSILESYLDQLGALTPVKLGGERKAISLKAEDNKILVNRLMKEGKFNNLLLASVTVLHFALFALATWLVYYYRTSPKTVVAILGSSVLSLMQITWGLRGLWREKWAIDMLVTILPNLSPEEALKVVKILYYSKEEIKAGASQLLDDGESKEK